jgi:predicted TIM-barrel fold metal-dependent hydrolase
MAIVDAHTHFFGPTYFATLASQSPREGTPADKIAAVARSAKIEAPIEFTPHLERWLGELDRHGVDHAAAFASVPEEAPDLGRAVELSGGRLSAFALANPRVEGAPARVAKLVSEKGFRGVLLFPAMHQYDLGGPEARELFKVLDEHRAIAYVHCGLLVVRLRDLFGLPRAIDLARANPISLIPVADAFPRARFVIPHFGAGFFREALFAGAQCENVLVDSSSSNSWTATQEKKLSLGEVFERALEVFGPRRILFGTDSGTFPAGWRRDRYEAQRVAIEALGAPRTDLERIFALNARELFGLAGRGSAATS